MAPRGRLLLLPLAVSLTAAGFISTAHVPDAEASTRVIMRDTFEGTLRGWRAHRAMLERIRRGVDRGAVRVVARKKARRFSLYRSRSVVRSTEAGATYVVRLVARSRPRGRICVRLQERAGGRAVRQARGCERVGRRWRVVRTRLRVASDGHTLRLLVYTRSHRRRSNISADRVRLVKHSPPASAQTLAPPRSLVVVCTRYASLTGDDAAAGTAEQPFRTAARLVASLSAGETGCLAGGTFREDLTIRTSGEAGAPITLSSAPGSRARLLGRLWVTDSADDVVLANLDLDGRNAGNLPSPTVNGDRVSFVGNDVTNRHAASICFVVGSTTGWGTAVDSVLDGNRVHDCGALPRTNQHHGVYLASSRDARLTNNLIYDNADRGVQLYPDAQGTLIAHNVIFGNGQGLLFAGDDGLAASDSHVVGNVIAGSLVRYNVESWYPPGNPVGTGNVVSGNCLWKGAQGNLGDRVGFAAYDNLVAAPGFVDAAAKDFRLRAGSSCEGKGLS